MSAARLPAAAMIAAAMIAAALCLPADAATLNDPNLTVTTHASGFSQPTGLRFLGGSAQEFFVIEKATGRVQHYDHGSVATALDLNVVSNSERGLLGIELDPQFAVNNRVYVYYSDTNAGGDTTSDGSWTRNVLARYEWDGSGLVNPVELMSIADDDPTGDGPNHDGGVIKFGPDGYLYGQLGDLNRDRAEQNIGGTSPASSSVGGIFRINASDGSPAAGNPFASHANSDFHQWFSYGFRNGFGMAWDPVTGDLWMTENGPGSYDEINRVTPGQNSGWNRIMGPDSRDPQGEGDLVHLADGGVSTYSDPEFSWQGAIGVTSIEFLAGTLLEGAGYGDAILVGDNNTGNIYLFRLDGSREALDLPDGVGLDDLVADSTAERNENVFGTGWGVTTDIVRGPDGALYVVDLASGDIFRVVPEPATAALLAIGGLGMLAAVGRRRLAAVRV